MTEITIPREALEAAARAIYNLCPITDEYDDVRAWGDLDATEQEAFWDEARAALLAGLKAWPGIKLNPSWELRTHKRSVEMILPVSEPPKMDRKAAVAERLFGDD